MSGIAAAVRFDRGPVPIDRVQAMIAAAPHRRPDGCTVWRGDGAALAKLHRLSLPAQSTSAQPAIDCDGVVGVFDGRLDNRSALATRFPEARLRDEDDDVRYVMAAVARLGLDGVDALEGDFAWAVWRPAARSLIAARDAMGMRPLYWMLDGDVLLLASDIAQIVAATSRLPAPDDSSLTDILLSEPPTDGRTLYCGVRQLLPGQALQGEAAGLRVVRYWRPEAAPPDRDRSDEDYAEECQALLDRAVSARLRARTPVAVFFSGGIDSSCVLASALHAPAGPALVPLSIDYREPESAEREYREEFSSFHGIRHIELEPDPIDLRTYVAQAARRRMPPDLPSQFIGRVARRAAAARGARVALTGEAGDALFAGTPYHYADLIARGRLAAAVGQYVRDWRNEESGWSPAGLVTDGLWPLLPQAWRERLRRPLRRVRGDGTGVRWVRGRGTQRPAVPDPPRGIPMSTWAIAWELNRGWTWYFFDMLERDAAEWGIEPRHPLTDRALVEFALRLPERQRRLGAVDKIVLRRAGRLSPRLSVRTTKAGLGHSLQRTLAALGGRGFFERLTLAEGGWVDGGEVLRGYDYVNRAAIPGDHRADMLLPRLWMLAALELWMRGGSMPNQDEQTREPTAPERERKRPYARPTLTEYGSVAKLTQGGGSKISDGGTTEKKCL
jgi:asparagine synthase (glutamine-hydrolysing)